MELRMSEKERDRMKVLAEVEAGHLKQKDAARLLGISPRQVRRSLRRFQEEGDKGLVHRSRGRGSNRRIDQSLKERALSLVKKKYKGFGPTLACEQLAKADGLSLSVETVRKWMTEEGYWKPKKRRIEVHQWRARRPCFGEMVQMDTSIHDWFEGRGESAVLISMIDDATSRCLKAFYDTDSTRTNMAMLRLYLERHGRPRAIYVDQASHFKTTRPTTIGEDLARRAAETQIGRALRELGIEHLTAHSPQAKGRIERSFGTDQDRLVKELRLADVDTIKNGNAYIETRYLPLWEERFTVTPAQPADVHRSISGYDLDAILSIQNTRTITNDYTVRYENQVLQIEKSEVGGGMRGSKVLVEERLDGSIHLRWGKRYLKHHRIEQDNKAAAVALPAPPVGLRPPSGAGRADHSPDQERTFLLGG